MSYRILLADDNHDFRHMIVEFLRDEGMDVVPCVNGARAIEKLSGGEHFDLVITDLLMPEADGIDVASYVRKYHPDIGIVVLSGGGITIDSTDILKAVDDLADVVFRKPVCLKSFKKSVFELLQRRESLLL